MKFKTKFLNRIRKLLTNRILDSVIASQLNKYPNFFVLKKIVPSNTLYRKESMRVCNRNGINYCLDLSDYQDWLLYFNSEADSSFAVLDYVKQGDLVLDVGGNIGQTALTVAQKIGETGQVFSFEPYPTTIERFERNLRLNSNIKNITIAKMALGEEKAELKMFQNCTTNSGGNRILHSFTQERDGVQQVEVTTLDDYVASKNISRKIDLIKIDVEGFEMKVLKGAITVLSRHKPDLFIELDDENLKNQGDSAKELVDFLVALDYEVFDVYDKKLLVVRKINQHTDIYCTTKRA